LKRGKICRIRRIYHKPGDPSTSVGGVIVMNILCRVPIDRCAWPLLAGLAGLLGLALFGPWRLLPVALVVLMGFVVFFFRDPDRESPTDPRAFVSPADGVVTEVRLNDQPKAGPLGGPCISIFLAVWNVHVNRVPHDGVVEKVTYVPGGHALAWKHSAVGNESNWIYFCAKQYRFVVRQIAGKIARRVVCRLRVGDSARKGQRLGIIKLGSRTDLYLPAGSQVLVQSGDRVYGGSSILALMPEPQNGSHS
jgi:phosphatidylserine decarboxylase